MVTISQHYIFLFCVRIWFLARYHNMCVHEAAGIRLTSLSESCMLLLGFESRTLHIWRLHWQQSQQTWQEGSSFITVRPGSTCMSLFFAIMNHIFYQGMDLKSQWTGVSRFVSQLLVQQTFSMNVLLVLSIVQLLTLLLRNKPFTHIKCNLLYTLSGFYEHQH